jgi:anti-anti-sigma regulatory factor
MTRPPKAARRPASAAPAEAKPESPPATPPARAGLKLEASCTLRDSLDLQFQLLTVDFGDSDVRVDGSAVERVDTAGLQLLLSFAKQQMARGKVLHWTAVSPELLRGSQLLGLAGMLGFEVPPNGSSARGN